MVAVVLLVIGVEAFARRDIGATSAVPTPGLPRALVGLRGPIGRAAGENLRRRSPGASGSDCSGCCSPDRAGSFTEQLAKSPEFVDLLSDVFPGVDIASVGGFLQLVFVEFGLILAGLAAATLVGGWASDETSGRLEMLLAPPLAGPLGVVRGPRRCSSASWCSSSSPRIGIAIGASLTGGDMATPVVGSLVLGLYAAALGHRLRGRRRWSARFAAPARGGHRRRHLGSGCSGRARAARCVQELALTPTTGQPMVGQWDAVGIVASMVLAVGGVAIGAWGFGGGT